MKINQPQYNDLQPSKTTFGSEESNGDPLAKKAEELLINNLIGGYWLF